MAADEQSFVPVGLRTGELGSDLETMARPLLTTVLAAWC